MEIIVRLIGMCLTFLPVIYFVTYVIKRATEEQKFDLHINRVKDKKGIVGVIIAYINRISLFIVIMSLGIYISSYFINGIFFDIFIISLIVFIFSYFFDNKNDIS